MVNIIKINYKSCHIFTNVFPNFSEKKKGYILWFVLLFVFQPLQPIMVLFSQPGSGL
jgi:hypothetical protein